MNTGFMLNWRGRGGVSNVCMNTGFMLNWRGRGGGDEISK